MEELSPVFWIDLVNESGLPLVLNFVLAYVCWTLFRITQQLHNGRLEDAKTCRIEQAERDDRNANVLHDQAKALESMAEQMKEWTRELRDINRHRSDGT